MKPPLSSTRQTKSIGNRAKGSERRKLLGIRSAGCGIENQIRNNSGRRITGRRTPRVPRKEFVSQVLTSDKSTLAARVKNAMKKTSISRGERRAKAGRP